METTTQKPPEDGQPGSLRSGDLFALVESRKCYFWLAYEREHRSPLVESGMIWRCRCAAPQSYEVTGTTVEEAVRNALTRAAELEANIPHHQRARPNGEK